MITAVHLENWRAYKSFKIELKRGTTFLVAPNGVGKTSFIEAVQWALDSDAKPTSKVMRRRARTTSVDVTLLGRFYERYADHAVSVARRVVFLVTGERVGT